MKFKTHNDNIPFIGGCLVGYVDVDYKTIKSVFGKPFNSCTDKCDAEWSILFDDGTEATIYNYKDGKNYLGRKGTPKTQITNWHIGGYNERAVELVTKALEL
jgi:hypothetical protein